MKAWTFVELPGGIFVELRGGVVVMPDPRGLVGHSQVVVGPVALKYDRAARDVVAELERAADAATADDAAAAELRRARREAERSAIVGAIEKVAAATTPAAIVDELKPILHAPQLFGPSRVRRAPTRWKPCIASCLLDRPRMGAWVLVRASGAVGRVTFLPDLSMEIGTELGRFRPEELDVEDDAPAGGASC